MPGVARVEISKWSVPHHTISSLIACFYKQAIKHRNIPSERTPKKIPPRNGPQRKHHPIVVVTNKKQT
jgi:hypothetical protein